MNNGEAHSGLPVVLTLVSTGGIIGIVRKTGRIRRAPDLAEKARIAFTATAPSTGERPDHASVE
jgi:Na+/H+ antiporter NhaC